MNKSIIYLFYFAAYTVLLLFFGKSGFKKTNNMRDFFVAGNSLGLATSVFSFCATWFSAASMQGVTGSLYSYGYSVVLYSIIPWFVGAFLIYKMSHRLREYDILTIPEFFYIRYNSKLLQFLGGVIIVVTYTLYIIIQIRGFGIVISQLLDINYFIALVLIYLFIIYITFGGLFSVSKTHCLNFVLVIIGVIISSGIVLENVGGFIELNKKAALINTLPFPAFLQATERGGLLDIFAKGQMPLIVSFTSFFGWGLGLASNPQYAIRVISAKNSKVSGKMILISVLVLSFLYLGLIVIGVGGRTLVPSISTISSVDEVFPYIINNVIYSPFSGLILIAIATTSISTANSQLLLAASGFTYDIFKNIANSKMDEERFLNFNRVFIFIVCTISLILTIDPPNSLLVYGGYIWGIFSSTFLFPLYGGLFWKESTREGAISSFILGLLTFALLMAVKIDSNIHPAFFSVIVSGLSFYVTSKYYKRGRANEN